jgi:hypothetical protein
MAEASSMQKKVICVAARSKLKDHVAEASGMRERAIACAAQVVIRST